LRQAARLDGRGTLARGAAKPVYWIGGQLRTSLPRWAFSESVQADIAIELALAAPELIQLPPQDFQRHAIASRATVGFESFVPGELVELGDPLIH
jgi:hypothetical protein